MSLYKKTFTPNFIDSKPYCSGVSCPQFRVDTSTIAEHYCELKSSILDFNNTCVPAIELINTYLLQDKLIKDKKIKV